MKLHLQAILWLKFGYSLFLANIPITCEQLIIGTPCYLSNWNIRYGRMKMNLVVSCKVLGIYFHKIKIQIACSSMVCKFLRKPYLVIWAQTFKHMLLILVVSFVKSCWPLSRRLSCPKIKITYISYSYTGNTLKHASIHQNISTPTLGVDKNMS